MADSRDDLVRKALAAIPKLDANWEQRLNDAGLETWRTDDDPLSQSTSSGFADPRTGAAVSFKSWDASESVPQDYPAGWPFIPGLDVSFNSATPSLLWDEAADPDHLCTLIASDLAKDGWRDRESNDLPPGLRTIRWFHSDGVWRVLTTFAIHGTDNEIAVGLAEKSGHARPNEEL